MALLDAYSVELIDPKQQHYVLRFNLGGETFAWLLQSYPTTTPIVVQLTGIAQSHTPLNAWDEGIITFADDPLESMKRGCLKFELAGRRLCGGFVLVRTMSIGQGAKRQKAWRLRRIEEAHIDAPSEQDSALWPAAGVTRGELSDYYARIAPYMTRYFEDRPYTVLRAPSGVAGALFFEHDPDARLRSKTDFQALAMIPAVELHAMNYHADRPQLPDWIVLDLDTPGQNFGILQQAASVVQDVLSSMNLNFMWKLSGHHGLHALIPIKRLYETVVVFDFAKLLAEMIYERAPRLLTRKVSTHLESERVLVDYHRNHYHQSIVAPFSPRAVSHPNISLPLSWDELARAKALPVYGIGLSENKLKEAGAILNEAVANPNDLEPAFVLIEQTVRRAL